MRKWRFEEEDSFAFMTEPAKSVRTYDSTLSHPGRFCTNCRGFVPSTSTDCPVCNSAEPIMFDNVAFASLNHLSRPLYATKTA